MYKIGMMDFGQVVGVATLDEMKNRMMAQARGELKCHPDEPKTWVHPRTKGLVRETIVEIKDEGEE